LVRASVELAEGDLAAALEDLDAAEADPALRREVALRRAAVEVVLGDADAAWTRLGPLLEEDPFDAAAHLLAARAAEQLGRLDEASAHAREALALVPGLAEAERILAAQ
jgi:tetratricopeptide (TPR) repeat protein